MGWEPAVGALPQVKFVPSLGYYSGTFVDKPVTPGAKFQGWVLQHSSQNRGNGCVLDTNRIGSVSLTPAPQAGARQAMERPNIPATPRVDSPPKAGHFPCMSTVIEIETAFRALPPRDQDALLGRLEEICEDHLELSDEYQAKLERAEQQLAEGRGRIRQPQA